jgi:hypothetical protein
MQSNSRLEMNEVCRSVEHKTFQLLHSFEKKSADGAIITSQVIALLLVTALSFSVFTFQYLFAISAVCLLTSILILMLDKKKEIGMQIAWSLIFLLPMIFALAGLYSTPSELQFLSPSSSNYMKLVATSNSSIEEYRTTFRAMFICVYLVPTFTLIIYKKLSDNHEKIHDKLTEF